MRCSAAVWEQYGYAREKLQNQLAHKIRSQMAALVGNMDSADLLLVAADGKKLPAHECILRARAPGFYQRHIEPTVVAMGPAVGGKIREVAVGDIDSSGLEFFIHSVYTEDEIAQFPPDVGETVDEEPMCTNCRKHRLLPMPNVPRILVWGDSDSRNSNASFNMDASTDLEDFKTQDREEHILPKGDVPQPHSSQQHNQHQQFTQIPMMTSFRDIASHSPMNSSLYSIGGRSDVGPDIPEEDEDGTCIPARRKSSRQETTMGKFIRLDSTDDGERTETESRRRSNIHKPMFSMFIGLDESTSPGERMVYGGVPEGVRGRAMIAKRLSVASLSSLTSIDMTPNHDGNAPIADRTPSCKLASDLLEMYIDNKDSDVVIKCDNGELFAHRCILSATCPFFRQQLQKSRRIELKGYNKSSVHFLLCFLYGGLTAIPDEVDTWEVLALATHLNLKDLIEVVSLHLKATKCHWFHRPCAVCVSAVFDALPQFYSIRCLKPLYEEAIQWQAKYFARIWKGRVFMHLNERWLKECFEGVIQQLDDETLIETILGCERLQVAFSRSRSEAAFTVLNMVNDILDVGMQYLIHSFHLVITSKSFAAQGKGLALNLGILEDILPTLVHSLSADVAIKSYLGLADLLTEIQSVPPSPKKTLSIPIDEWSPRFYVLVRRLYELVDKHLLHYAASVVRAEAWNLLNERDQVRIRETGIFVEMRQPKASMPRFSSNNRAYKRSASAGVQMGHLYTPERGRSLERHKPLTMIQQKARDPESEPIEDEKEVFEEPKPSTSAVKSPKMGQENKTTQPAEAKKQSPRQQSPRKPQRQPTPTKEEKPPQPAESGIPRPRSSRNSSRATSRESTPRTVKEVTPRTPRPEAKTEAKAEAPVEKPKPKQPDAEVKKPAPPKPVEIAPEPEPSTSKGPEIEAIEAKPERVEKKGAAAAQTAQKPATKSKSPTKKRIQDLEEHKMERQNTHTIIHNDPVRTANLPGPSPLKDNGEKPKSVVKPMPKADPPLAGTSRVATVPKRTPTTASAPAKSNTTAAPSSTRTGIPQPKPSGRVITASTPQRQGPAPIKTTASAEAKKRADASPRARSPRIRTRTANPNNIEN